MPPFASKTATIKLRARGPSRIVVVADTHSKPHPAALELIAKEKPKAILHGGDIGALDVVDALAEIAPTYPVRGNIDTRLVETPDELIIDLEGEGGMRVLLTHIAVRGPRLRRDVKERAKRAEAQLVVCGHSHVPLLVEDDGLFVFNPGSIGPRRFTLPITFGVMERTDTNWSMRHVSCETGERWLPAPAT